MTWEGALTRGVTLTNVPQNRVSARYELTYN